MTVSTSRPHAESILRFLDMRTEQFEVFHSGNARLIVQGFIDFFDRDDVLMFIAQALQRRSGAAKKWCEAALRENRVPPLPDDPFGAMALRYGVLKLVRMDKLDMRHFASNLFPGSFLDEKLMHWKRLIVHPFGADLRALARLLIARMPEGDWVDMGALVEEVLAGPFAEVAFGPRPWNDDDDRRVEADEAARKKKKDGKDAPPAAAPAGAAAAEDAGATLDALERAVREAGLGESAGDDLLLDVAALRLEARRRERQPARIAARLDDLAAAHGPLRAACERARAALA